MIIGRCADYALEDYPNVLNVFIAGDEKDKLERIKTLYNLDDSKAKEVIVKTDKKRSSYYNYYSNKRWGDPRSYDLCLNSSFLGIDGSVEMIKKVITMKESQK